MKKSLSNGVKKKETVVISVGGSLISPQSGIDVSFLKKLKLFVESHVARGYQFVIITGGGATARNYQNAGRKVGDIATEDLDWLGIHSTRLNGHLLRSIFRKYALPALVKNPLATVPAHKPVIIAAGWKPGFSTDYVAVKLAQKINAKRVVNLSDIDYVYDKDPKKNKNAKPIKVIAWQDFREVIPKKWDPGLSSPFDPVAAKQAESLKLEVAMINGKKLGEFEKYLGGKKFVGTRIA
jgi:uridylate kinase